jgi:hypothetical protein
MSASGPQQKKEKKRKKKKKKKKRKKKWLSPDPVQNAIAQNELALTNFNNNAP